MLKAVAPGVNEMIGIGSAYRIYAEGATSVLTRHKVKSLHVHDDRKAL